MAFLMGQFICLAVLMFIVSTSWARALSDRSELFSVRIQDDETAKKIVGCWCHAMEKKFKTGPLPCDEIYNDIVEDDFDALSKLLKSKGINVENEATAKCVLNMLDVCEKKYSEVSKRVSNDMSTKLSLFRINNDDVLRNISDCWCHAAEDKFKTTLPCDNMYKYAVEQDVEALEHLLESKGIDTSNKEPVKCLLDFLEKCKKPTLLLAKEDFLSLVYSRLSDDMKLKRAMGDTYEDQYSEISESELKRNDIHSLLNTLRLTVDDKIKNVVYCWCHTIEKVFNTGPMPCDKMYKYIMEAKLKRAAFCWCHAVEDKYQTGSLPCVVIYTYIREEKYKELLESQGINIDAATEQVLRDIFNECYNRST
ncbi:hypothetical protein M8J77_026403 [Diaphorina citri]|nr:hypothetical protein M8J77_026403 [Diaphorina citri]